MTMIYCGLSQQNQCSAPVHCHLALIQQHIPLFVGYIFAVTERDNQGIVTNSDSTIALELKKGAVS